MLELQEPTLHTDETGAAWWDIGGRRLPVIAGGDDGDEGGEGAGKGGDNGKGGKAAGGAGEGAAGAGEGAGTGGDDGDDAAARARQEAKGLRTRLRDSEAKVAELEAAGKSELERATAERDALKGQVEGFTSELGALRVETAVLRRASTFGIHDPDAAASLLDKSLLEEGEDGKPTAKSVDAALRDVVKRKPYLTRTGGADAGGGGEDRGGAGAGGDANAALRAAIAAKKGHTAHV